MLKMCPGSEAGLFDDFIWHNFIPKEHQLIKIKKFINLDFLGPLIRNSYSNERSVGRDPIDPRIMFLICLLEELTGLSDVKMEEQLFLVPLYRWFVGLGPMDKVPDASTISYFRTKRMGDSKFKESFNQLVQQLHQEGLIDGKIQSQDATDIRGDVAILSPLQLVDRCRKRLLAVVKKINENKHTQLLKKYDFKLERQPGNRQKHFEDLLAVTNGLVATIKRSKKLLRDPEIQRELSIIERALEERKDEYYDEVGQKQKKDDVSKITGKMINPSDPDVSWGAKSDKKFFAGYKASINTDHKYGLATEVEVNKAGHPEEKSAAPMLQKQKDNLGIVPDHFTADAKYDYGNTRTEVKAVGQPEKDINLYIPLVPTKNKEGGFLLDEFYFENAHLFCPEGYPAEYVHHDEKKLGFEFKFNASVCATCPRKTECTKAKYGRRVFVSSSQFERSLALSFNNSEQYDIVYKDQHWKVEPKNADLKRNHGLRRARFKGLSRTRIQAYLAVTASNLKKVAKIIMGKIADGVINTLAKLTALSPPVGEVCPNTG